LAFYDAAAVYKRAITMRVAAIQMNSGPHKSQNLAQAHDLLIEAVDERRAQFVAFPEHFSLFTGDTQELLAGAEPLKGSTVETLQEWAAEYDVWILGGSIPLKSSSKADPRLTNTSLLISPEGEISARYDKMHLFDVDVAGEATHQESKHFKPGKKTVAVETWDVKVGMSLCYDLRFPELFRELSSQGAQVLFTPAAFTAHTGKAHWDVLTRARAIENQAFLVAPAQCGSPYPGRETHGYTRIIDPWGRIIAERPAGPGVVVANLDFEMMNKIRQDMPVLAHRKL
jgi:predicted amidohydrolase